jgi:glycosyltransferase involved in cell wall biosynthesis
MAHVASKPRFSLVIPVYKNESGISDLIGRCEFLHKALTPIEFVFVVDGSPDNSLEFLRLGLANTELRYKVINLSRNFGAINAVRWGVKYTENTYMCVMAADLQEPAELIVELLSTLLNSDSDIVIARRISRRDRFWDKVFSKFSWFIYRSLINAEVPRGGMDIFACSPKVVSVINKIDEQNSSLFGLIFWVGFKKTFVDYHREKRSKGKSSWTFTKKVNYFFDSIYSFTDLPLRLLQVVGIFGISVSVLIAVSTVIEYLLNNIAVPGYTTLAILITFTTSSILTAIGVLGAYIWRTFSNSQLRPYAIEESVSSNPD